MATNRRTLKEAYQPDHAALKEFALGTSHDESKAIAFETEILVPISAIHKTFSFTPDGRPVRYYYDIEELRAWAESDLKKNGIRTALWVRPMLELPGAYELVAGLRRLTGGEMIGLHQVPVKIFNWSDEEAYAAAFDENDQRQNFNQLEELDITLNLFAQQLKIDRQQVVSLLFQMDNSAKGKTSQEFLATPAAQLIEDHFRSRGAMTWRSFVAKRLPLLRKPPEILEVIRSSKLDYRKAIEISRIKDEKQRQNLLAQAIELQPTLEQVKKQVQAMLLGLEEESMLEVDEQEGTAALPIGERLDTVWKQLKKAKVFENPKKQKQAKKLLEKLEALLNG